MFPKLKAIRKLPTGYSMLWLINAAFFSCVKFLLVLYGPAHRNRDVFMNPPVVPGMFLKGFLSEKEKIVHF